MRWIDSINHLIKKEESHLEGNPEIIFRYFNNCISLGEYYEKLYDKKILATNKKAIYYFLKVSEVGTFPYDDRYFKAAALKNNLCRKLAAIYFDGKGVRKNKNLSLQLALEGSYGYTVFEKYYSMKYFHCLSLMPAWNILPDFNLSTAFTIPLNPFVMRLGLPHTLLDKRLQGIAIAFIKRANIDSTLKIILTGFPGYSMLRESLCERLLSQIKLQLGKQLNISFEKIITDCDRNNNFDSFDIYFRKVYNP